MELADTYKPEIATAYLVHMYWDLLVQTGKCVQALRVLEDTPTAASADKYKYTALIEAQLLVLNSLMETTFCDVIEINDSATLDLIEKIYAERPWEMDPGILGELVGIASRAMFLHHASIEALFNIASILLADNPNLARELEGKTYIDVVLENIQALIDEADNTEEWAELLPIAQRWMQHPNKTIADYASRLNQECLTTHSHDA